MIHKLIPFIIYILIGLSIILSGCILFAMDPLEDRFEARYINNSENVVTIKFKSLFNADSDSVTVNPATHKTILEFVVDDGKNANHEIADFYSNIEGSGYLIELFANGLLRQTWRGNSGSFGDTMNSPLNYDSWKLNEAEKIVEFTITDADLVIED